MWIKYYKGFFNIVITTMVHIWIIACVILTQQMRHHKDKHVAYWTLVIYIEMLN